MKPIRRGQLDENIDSAIVTFSDTGEVCTLTTHRDSANHFFPHFIVGDYEIRLRLDWTCIDSNGQPMLDANFIDKETGIERRRKGARIDAHNTESLPGEHRCYNWSFSGFTRQFSVSVTWRASVSENIQLTDSYSAEVIRAVDRKPY
jgi:hypothetical protein